MEELNNLLQVDIIQWFYTGFIIVSGIVAVFVAIDQLCKYLGKPLKWFNRNNKDHELLVATVKKVEETKNDLEEINKQSIRHDQLIKDGLNNIKSLVYDQIISSWRFEILDMASAISLGRNYSKEQYDHIIEIHEKYDDLLESIHQTNGKVNASMEVIMETYKEKLKNGF